MAKVKRKIITQIGSLPYENVREAVRYSLKHDIPFLPELPKLRDAMLDYIKNPGKLSSLDEFKKHRFSVVKIQCVGPATLIMSGYTQEEALERICEHISGIIKGLEAEETILFLDEPALGQVGFDFQALWVPIFETFKVTPGIHCCGNMDWDILFNSSVIEVISFDASQFDITKYPHYRGDKRIAWGIEERKDVKDFHKGDLLTLPCGMSPVKYTTRDCEPALKKLKRISKIFLKN